MIPETGPLVQVGKGYQQPSQCRVKVMSKKRTRYSAQFKFQIGLKVAKGMKTIKELGGG